MTRWGRLRRRAGDERGGLLPLVAAGVAAILAATSLSVDIGQLANRRRDLQSIADMVALDAAAVLGGGTFDALTAAGDVWDVAAGSAERNGFLRGTVTTTFGVLEDGRYADTADPATPRYAARLADAGGDWLEVALLTGDAAPFAPVAAGADPVTAVSVVAGDTVRFAFSNREAVTDQAAVAATHPTTGISIGSGLLELDPDATQVRVLNALLGSLLGAPVTAVTYDGLVGAEVTLADVAVELTAGSVDELLRSEIEVGELLHAMVTVLGAGHPAAVSLGNLADLAVPSATVRLGDLVAVSADGETAAATAALDVLSLLTALAQVADGDHAVQIDATLLGAPQLGTVPVALHVVEPPQWSFGAKGITVRTSQVALDLPANLSIATGNLAGDKCQLKGSGLLTGLVTLLVDCVIGGLLRLVVVDDLANVTLGGTASISVAVAAGEAELTELACHPAGGTAVVDPRLGGVTADATVALSGSVVLLGQVGEPKPIQLAVTLAADLLARDGPTVRFGAGGFPFGEYRDADGVTETLSLATASVAVTAHEAIPGLELSLGGEDTTLLAELVRRVLEPVNNFTGNLVDALDPLLGLTAVNGMVTALRPACGASRLAA